MGEILSVIKHYLGLVWKAVPWALTFYLLFVLIKNFLDARAKLTKEDPKVTFVKIMGLASYQVFQDIISHLKMLLSGFQGLAVKAAERQKEMEQEEAKKEDDTKQ